MRRLSKKWLEVLLSTAVACFGFSFIEGFYKASFGMSSSLEIAKNALIDGGSPLISPLNEMREELQSLLEGGEHYLGFPKSEEITPAILLSLYVQTGFQPLWFTEDSRSACAPAVMEMLSNADEEGLDALDYAPYLAQIKKYLSSKDFDKENVERVNLLRADILLSQVLLQYISDIRGERLSPKKIDKELYLEKPKINEPEILLNLLKDSSREECGWLEKIPPQNPHYKILKDVLKDLRAQKAQKGVEELLSNGPLLKKGMRGKRVLELRKALASRGYLMEAPLDPQVFDEVLEETVKRFQEDCNLAKDGIVGQDVQYYLSQNLEDKINQVIVTMERWRWMPEALGAKYIFVNIPEFKVRAYENEQLIFEMPIIVGRPYRETPVFDSKIVNVIFNPTWNVPRLIAVQDKLPDVQKKGAQYFIEKKIHVYKDGLEIDPRHINWATIRKESFNFHLKQDPGSQNALGRIRFTIISPFNVYLHGTPEQKLFDKTKRTLSSGCIRLENPVKMAKFVFGVDSKWTETAINAAIDIGKTQTIPLQKPVMVFIQYFTVGLDSLGKVQFLEDIYGQDKQILEALKARRARAP